MIHKHELPLAKKLTNSFPVLSKQPPRLGSKIWYTVEGYYKAGQVAVYKADHLLILGLQITPTRSAQGHLNPDTPENGSEILKKSVSKYRKNGRTRRNKKKIIVVAHLSYLVHHFFEILRPIFFRISDRFFRSIELQETFRTPCRL